MKRSNKYSRANNVITIDKEIKFMRQRALIKFIIGFLLIAFLVTNSLAAEEKTSKQILILASYNPGLRWTDSIGSEIENQLSIYYPTAEFLF